MSQFLRSPSTEARAATQIGTALRWASRLDLLQPLNDFVDDTIIFPATLATRPGRHLNAAIPSLSAITAEAATAIVPHLSFCESLLLPPPFPSAALAHYLRQTGGVLDLSPPRFPASSPGTLRHACELIAPLLAHTPPLTALHVPAQCISFLQPLEPLAPHLNTLTRLCLTLGHVLAEGPTDIGLLEPRDAVVVLERLSPSALRHLSIDADLDPNSAAVHRLLCSFTGLTSLRLNNPPRALPRLKSLSSLFLTHVPSRAADDAAFSAPPSLAHIHAIGPAGAVQQLRSVLTTPGVPPGPELHATPPVMVSNMLRADSGPYVCCSSPTLTGRVSMLCDNRAMAAVASSCMHLCKAKELCAALESTAWPRPAPSPHTLKATATPADLRTLTLCIPVAGCEVPPLAIRIAAGELLHSLRTLCVLDMYDVPPHSVVCAEIGPPLALPLPGPLGRGYWWVTAQPSGVRHPILALEMLHYNSAPASGATSAHASSPQPSVADHQGAGRLSTLRISLRMMPHFQARLWCPCVVQLPPRPLYHDAGMAHNGIKCAGGLCLVICPVATAGRFCRHHHGVATDATLTRRGQRVQASLRAQSVT